MNGLGRNEKNESNKQQTSKQTIFTKETLGVVLILFSSLCFICLLTRGSIFYAPGEWVNSFLFGVFGYFAYAVDVWVFVNGVTLVFNKKIGFSKAVKVYFTVFCVLLAILLHAVSLKKGDMSFSEYVVKSYSLAENGISQATAGGLITAVLCYGVLSLLSDIGTYIVLGVLIAVDLFLLCKYLFGKEKVSSATKPSGEKFKSSYVGNENTTSGNVSAESLGVEIQGEKEYPTFQTQSNSQVVSNQKLFVNNPQEFAIKTKREMMKGEDAPIRIVKNTGGLAVGVTQDVLPQEDDINQTKTDFQKKIDYIKTPVAIEVKDARFNNDNSNSILNASTSSTSTQTVVSDYIPKTERNGEFKNVEICNSQSTNRKVERDIPFFEHNENLSSGTDTRKDSTFANDTVRRAVNYAEKYVDVVDDAEVKAIEPKEVFRPIEREQMQSYSKVEKISNDSFGKNDQVGSQANEQLPESNIVRERRSRSILFGEEQGEQAKQVSGEEFTAQTDRNASRTESSFDVEKPAFTSRAVADNNRVVGFEKNKTEDEKPIEKPKPPINRVYNKPPIDLLERHTIPATAQPENHEERMEIIKRTLEEFHISAEPQSYIQGPAVTRYEITMPAGISVKKVLNYDDDLKMRLASRNGVRIEAPIPGKDLVGIEVANKTRVPVGLREVLEGATGKVKDGALMFAIGKDIVGNSKMDNLAKAPHFLVAGATGSGKSVALNVMIVSMIMRYSPEELRLILIDPKRVGFRIYEHIPHLMIDEIITEPQKAVAVLTWAYNEMEKRYAMFEECQGVISDIDAYNERIASDTVPKMARIVIVVDELADLMESCKKDMDVGIRKLAAKARAAGIHLVLATQRPSVDVITGTIKANLPSRMALKVMNFADSSTILSEGGAEKLLGNGDMLYKNSSMSECERYQGAWVTDMEINNIVSYIKEHNQAYFDDDLKGFLDKATKPKQDENSYAGEDEERTNEVDDFFIKALGLAVNTGTVSISQLQRRFSIGYARAGAIVDKMERMGFVSTNEGSKARRVLLSREEFEEKFGPMNDSY